MRNKKILILEGGFNEEHDVSLVTSKEIQKILNRNKVEFKTLIPSYLYQVHLPFINTGLEAFPNCRT